MPTEYNHTNRKKRMGSKMQVRKGKSMSVMVSWRESSSNEVKS